MDWVKIWTIAVTLFLLYSAYKAFATGTPFSHVVLFIVLIFIPFARVMGLI